MKGKRRNGKNKRREEREEGNPRRRVSSEVLRGISALFFIALGGFLVLASLGLGGIVGFYLYEWLSWLLGVGYMLLPLSLLLLAVAILRSFEKHFGVIQLGSMVVFLLSGLGLVNLAASGRGGVLGTALAEPIAAAVDIPATVIFLVTFAIASLIVAFNIHLGALFSALRERMQRTPAETLADAPIVGLHEEESEPIPPQEPESAEPE